MMKQNKANELTQKLYNLSIQLSLSSRHGNPSYSVIKEIKALITELEKEIKVESFQINKQL